MRYLILLLIFVGACKMVPGPECKALLLAYDDHCIGHAGEGICTDRGRGEIEAKAYAGNDVNEERVCHETITVMQRFEELKKKAEELAR